MPLKPVRPRRLYREIANQLVGMIASGELAAGERLPTERELCATLDVSRTSVREALIALELAGAVEVRSGSGVHVRAGARTAPIDGAQPAFSPFETLAARLMIEPGAARLAAANASRAQVAGIAEAFRRLAHGTLEARREGDRLFHFRIAEASGNTALTFVVDELWRRGSTPIGSRLEQLALDDARRARNIAEHRAVLEALRKRDPAAAARAMRTHLNNANRSRLARWPDDREHALPAGARARR